MTFDRAAAVRELQLLEDELARRGLLRFTISTHPAFRPNWHHVRLARELDDVLAGKTRRLIVCMPPQNGKSELVSRRFPAYALGRFPDLRVIAGSYSASLANDMSRDVQRIMSGDDYARIFPATRLASGKDPEVRMAAQFAIVGRSGSYRGAGVGGGITGKSMDIGIIDDPVKSRAEAESETYRKNVWDWFVGDFSTRQSTADAAIIITLTRWHEDDLAGRLLRLAKENPLADQWRVVSFPAICEETRGDDPRAVGEALWPARFPIEELRMRQATAGEYDWSALYQQRPTPAGGGMFKREWFTRVLEVARGNVLRRCRAWDCASTVPTPGRDPDYTVGTLLAQLTTGEWLVEHVIRERVTPAAVDRLILATAQADGRQTMIREEQEGGSSGKAVIAARTKALAGYDYAGVHSSGEKSTRWRPFAVQAEAGNVILNARGTHWHREWIDELALCPYGRHDDQADSVALAFNALTAHVDFGATVAAVMPRDRDGQPTGGEWRRKYFARVEPTPAEPEVPLPRRAITFDEVR